MDFKFGDIFISPYCKDTKKIVIKEASKRLIVNIGKSYHVWVFENIKALFEFLGFEKFGRPFGLLIKIFTFISK